MKIADTFPTTIVPESLTLQRIVASIRRTLAVVSLIWSYCIPGALAQDDNQRLLPWYRVAVVLHQQKSPLSVMLGAVSRQIATQNTWQFYAFTLGGTYQLKKLNMTAYANYGIGEVNGLGRGQIVQGALFYNFASTDIVRPVVKFDTDYIWFAPLSEKDIDAPGNLRLRLEGKLLWQLASRWQLTTSEELFLKQNGDWFSENRLKAGIQWNIGSVVSPEINYIFRWQQAPAEDFLDHMIYVNLVFHIKYSAVRNNQHIYNKGADF